MYLVWYKAVTGKVEAYKTITPLLDLNDKEIPYLQRHSLSKEEFSWPIALLEEKYPPPEV